MRFDPPLVRGTLVRRYKRFLADVLLADGETVVAHCANSGSMLGVAVPGAEAWISPSDKPGRALRWTWELVRIGHALVGIHTDRPNRLAAEALAQGAIPELAGYGTVRREVKYGRNSRIDLLLEAPGRPTCFVEVKNVTLRRGISAGVPVEFPDSVTERGSKHLAELADMVALGHRAVMLYVAQREDGDRFRFATDIDPAYGAAARHAKTAGVDSICYRCRVETEGVQIADAIPIDWPA